MDKYQQKSDIRSVSYNLHKQKRLKPELYKSKYFQQIIERELRAFKNNSNLNIARAYRHKI